MNLPEFVQALQTLQPLQAEHDRKAHRAVLNWRRHRRLRHYTLHFGKYINKLLQNEAAEPHVLIDTVIITMAMANALGISLATVFSEGFYRKQVNADTCGQILLTSFSLMCKLSEAREHRENLPYEQKWIEACGTWFIALLWVVEQFPADLTIAIPRRWQQVESNTK